MMEAIEKGVLGNDILQPAVNMSGVDCVGVRKRLWCAN